MDKIEQVRKVKIITLGCRLNQADEALLYGRLATLGYKAAEKGEKKDLIIVNTCTVTNSASQKSRQALRKLRRENPHAKIAVTGCDLEVNENFWFNEPACDILIPGSQKDKICEFLQNNARFAKIANSEKEKDENIFFENSEAQFPFKSRPLVKIQEGCDCFCAYCIVPFARGKPRSRSLPEVINECKRLINSGHKEIVLTGVNICKYSENGRNLISLAKEILAIKGDFRLRLSSTEPDSLLLEILSIMKENPKLCRFLHIPLQHGTDEILTKMRRQYSLADFAKFAEKALSELPGLHLGTDIICGLPGETDFLFEKSFSFISKIPFANIHIFRYSPRQGTEAAKFANRPSQRELRERMKVLERLKKELSYKFLSSQISSTASFIGEKKEKNGSIVGWSDNYIKTRVDTQDEIGQIIKIKFTSFDTSSSLNAVSIKYK